MKALAAIRVAKLVALLGFFLPWMLVSCSNQPILTASGLDLAVGSFNFHNPTNGQIDHHLANPDILVLLAMLAAAGGFAFSFKRSGGRVLGGLVVAAGAGLTLSYFGFELAKASITHQLSGEAARRHSDVSLQGLLVFQSQPGFTITLIGFGAALAVGLFAIWSQRALDGAATAGGAVPPQPPDTGTANACETCTAPVEANARFCGACGAPASARTVP